MIHGPFYTVLKCFNSSEITIGKLIHLLRLFSSLFLPATEATLFFVVIKGIMIRVTWYGHNRVTIYVWSSRYALSRTSYFRLLFTQRWNTIKHLTVFISDVAVFHLFDLMIFIQFLCLLQTEGKIPEVLFFQRKRNNPS